MRLFDVAVNDSVVMDDLDIWAESGHDAALKKVVYVPVKGGKMILSFPEVKAGQALISAIAIARQGEFEVQEMPEPVTFSWKDFDRDRSGRQSGHLCDGSR